MSAIVKSLPSWTAGIGSLLMAGCSAVVLADWTVELATMDDGPATAVAVKVIATSEGRGLAFLGLSVICDDDAAGACEGPACGLSATTAPEAAVDVVAAGCKSASSWLLAWLAATILPCQAGIFHSLSASLWTSLQDVNHLEASLSVGSGYCLMPLGLSHWETLVISHHMTAWWDKP
jgi:hypothetical protein